MFKRIFVLWIAATLALAPAMARAADEKDKPKEQPRAREKDKPGEQPTGEYIEYKCVPELNQITVCDCGVRGEKSVKYLQDHAAELKSRGIYACVDKTKRHTYPHTENLAGHKIDLVIIISPPTGHGEGGEYFTQRLVVRIDGRKKIDCSLGTTADGELWVSQVTIHPEDGTIETRALSADGDELSVPEGHDSIDNPAVIRDGSFFEDDPAEAPKTERASAGPWRGREA